MKTILLLTALGCFSAGVSASNVCQWRGNDRTGLYPESGLLKSWPGDGPKKIWDFKEAGAGYGSAAVVGNAVYLTGNDPKSKKRTEWVTALDASSGTLLWKTAYGGGWTGSYPEARVTPTVSNGEIFVISGNGIAASLDAESGVLKWSRDVKGHYEGKVTDWGTAESPLIDSGKFFYTVGSVRTTLVALNTRDGSTVWESESLGDGAEFVSPVLITHNGKRQIVGGTYKHLFGADPENGKILWKVDLFKIKKPGIFYGTRFCNTPLYKDGKIFISAGYDYGTMCFEINGASTDARLLWLNEDLDNHHHGIVISDTAVYGSAWVNNNKGIWVCVDVTTGKTLYRQPWDRHGKGSIIGADGMFYCYDEQRGTVALVKPDTAKFEVVSSFDFKGGSGRHWSHPVIAGGKLYMRRGGFVSCFDLRGK